jgi:hypothetical protein
MDICTSIRAKKLIYILGTRNIGGIYIHIADKKQSAHIFKSNVSWVKVSDNVEKIAIDESHNIQDEIQENEYLYV